MENQTQVETVKFRSPSGERFSKRVGFLSVMLYNNGNDDAFEPSIRMKYRKQGEGKQYTLFKASKSLSLLDYTVFKTPSDEPDFKEFAAVLFKDGLRDIDMVAGGNNSQRVVLAFAFEGDSVAHLATEDAFISMNLPLAPNMVWPFELTGKSKNSGEYELAKDAAILFAAWDNMSVALKK